MYIFLYVYDDRILTLENKVTKLSTQQRYFTAVQIAIYLDLSYHNKVGTILRRTNLPLMEGRQALQLQKGYVVSFFHSNYNMGLQKGGKLSALVAKVGLKPKGFHYQTQPY
jgi:hypothetical protein